MTIRPDESISGSNRCTSSLQLLVPDPETIAGAWIAKDDVIDAGSGIRLTLQDVVPGTTRLVSSDDACTITTTFLDTVESRPNALGSDVRWYGVAFACADVPWADLPDDPAAAYGVVSGRFDALMTVMTR